MTSRLSATGRSVTTNWVGPYYAVLNGTATFITLADGLERPREVRLEMPDGWRRSMSGLAPAPDGLSHHYRAPDFDTLADSPIVVGNPVVHEFEVDGSRHVNVFRRGGGGLEHLNSMLLTAGASQSSLEVWTSSTSGVGTNPETTVSCYVKGAVVGLLLDARIRRLTNDTKSLDDVTRLALARYGGERGFTPEQSEATASEVAGADLSGWFARAIYSADELDYDENLDWWGLRFAERDPADRATAWTLEVRADATDDERRHLEALLTPGGTRPF